MMRLMYEEVMLDPAIYFKDPEELMTYPGFDVLQKRKILKAWELDLTLLQVCDEENMSAPGEVRLLSRIHQAIQDIEKRL